MSPYKRHATRVTVTRSALHALRGRRQGSHLSPALSQMRLNAPQTAPFSSAQVAAHLNAPPRVRRTVGRAPNATMLAPRLDVCTTPLDRATATILRPLQQHLARSFRALTTSGAPTARRGLRAIGASRALPATMPQES
jgi:hypothetical protein